MHTEALACLGVALANTGRVIPYVIPGQTLNQACAELGSVFRTSPESHLLISCSRTNFIPAGIAGSNFILLSLT